MQQITLFDLPEVPPSPRRLTQSQQLDLLVDELLAKCPPELHRSLVVGLQARIIADSASQLETQERLQLLDAIAKQLISKTP